jgi:hypothetical protein
MTKALTLRSYKSITKGQISLIGLHQKSRELKISRVLSAIKKQKHLAISFNAKNKNNDQHLKK